MAGFIRQAAPFIVPTEDGKLIEEHFGLVSAGSGAYSVAHMVAPAGWGEPYQQPDFDEITIVIRGRKRIEVESEVLDLGPGETLLIKAGTRVRYSNPFAEETEYWSLCVPAFSPDYVNRE